MSKPLFELNQTMNHSSLWPSHIRCTFTLQKNVHRLSLIYITFTGVRSRPTRRNINSCTETKYLSSLIYLCVCLYSCTVYTKLYNVHKVVKCTQSCTMYTKLSGEHKVVQRTQSCTVYSNLQCTQSCTMHTKLYSVHNVSQELVILNEVISDLGI